MTVTCNDPMHQARRQVEALAEQYRASGDLHQAGFWQELADRRTEAEPCLICGAPIDKAGNGHDPGCMGLDS